MRRFNGWATMLWIIADPHLARHRLGPSLSPYLWLSRLCAGNVGT